MHALRREPVFSHLAGLFSGQHAPYAEVRCAHLYERPSRAKCREVQRNQVEDEEDGCDVQDEVAAVPEVSCPAFLVPRRCVALVRPNAHHCAHHCTLHGRASSVSWSHSFVVSFVRCSLLVISERTRKRATEASRNSAALSAGCS